MIRCFQLASKLEWQHECVAREWIAASDAIDCGLHSTVLKVSSYSCGHLVHIEASIDLMELVYDYHYVASNPS